MVISMSFSLALLCERADRAKMIKHIRCMSVAVLTRERETKREFNAFCRVSHYAVILCRLFFFKSANCLAASYSMESMNLRTQLVHTFTINAVARKRHECETYVKIKRVDHMWRLEINKILNLKN